MNLTDLKPRLRPESWEINPSNPPRFQSLMFLCPLCRKHEVGVEIWAGSAGLVDLGEKTDDGKPIIRKLWRATQGPYRDWETLSITPSISCAPSAKHKCAGWHGFITNGQVT